MYPSSFQHPNPTLYKFYDTVKLSSLFLSINSLSHPDSLLSFYLFLPLHTCPSHLRSLEVNWHQSWSTSTDIVWFRCCHYCSLHCQLGANFVIFDSLPYHRYFNLPPDSPVSWASNEGQGYARSKLVYSGRVSDEHMYSGKPWSREQVLQQLQQPSLRTFQVCYK